MDASRDGSEERPRLGGHVRLFTGGTVWPLDPRPGDELVFHGEDAAHMLSGESRFCSATFEPYSVGQHSVHVSQVVAHRLGLVTAAAWASALDVVVELVLAAHIHDLPEMILKDLPGPWKKHVWVDAPGGGTRRYSALEEAWVAILFPRFGLSPSLANHPLIKSVDKAMCATEKRDLYQQDEETKKTVWHVDQTGQKISGDELLACMAFPSRLYPWSYWTTRSEFLKRLNDLTTRLADARHRAGVAK